MVRTQHFSLDSDGGLSAIPITDQVSSFVAASGVREGQVLIYYLHTTGAVLVMEHEAGILADLEETLEALIPLKKEYKHHLRGVDDNGCAHIRSALLGPSIILPVQDSKLVIGQYQEILLLDMQTGRKPRQYVLQVMGE